VAAIRFTLVNGATFDLTVENPSASIHEFAQGPRPGVTGVGSQEAPLRGMWIYVDGEALISRQAIVSVEPVEG
jgi:hypothetical protein